MNKIKAVIFDMDGVLMDTEHYNSNYYLKIFADMGITVSIEEFTNIQGGNSETFWTYFSNKYSLKKPSEEERNKHRLGFIEFLKSENVRPIEGVEELIRDLHQHKIPIALASSGSKLRIAGQLKLINLLKYFPVIISGQEVKNGKPDPEIFLKAARRLKVKPTNCVVIEDSERGIEAAIAAGMKVIGYAGSEHNSHDLSKADKVIHSFTDLTSDIIQSL